jgi:hypothetical protein
MKNIISSNKIMHTLFFRNCIKSLVILLFLISLGYAENTEDKEKALVTNVIDAYGGKEALAKVASISAEGHIKNYFSNDEGTYFRYMKRERKLFVDIKYSKSAEKRILNGDKGYRGTTGKVSEVKGPSYDAMVYQYNQLDLPYGLIDDTFKITYLRKDSLGGVDAEILKLEDKFGHEIEVYVSTKDFLILKVIGYFKKGDDKMSLGAEFSNYRKVEGILLPFKITNYADTSKISETEITKYSINPTIDESIYFTIQ